MCISSPSSYYGLLLWFPEYFKCVYEEANSCYFERGRSCAANASSLCPSSSHIYTDSLYAALATIPGTLLGILTINLIGARTMLCREDSVGLVLIA